MKDEIVLLKFFLMNKVLVWGMYGYFLFVEINVDVICYGLYDYICLN